MFVLLYYDINYFKSRKLFSEIKPFRRSHMMLSFLRFLFLRENKSLSLFVTVELAKCRSSHRRCSVRKGVLRNFAKFTGKHLCQSLYFNKVAGLIPEEKNTFFTEHLWATASASVH